MGAQNGTISVWDVEKDKPIYTKKDSSSIRTVSWPQHGFLAWGNENGHVYGSIVDLDNASKAFKASESSLSSSVRYNAVFQIVVSNNAHTSDKIPKYATAAVLYEDGVISTARLNLSKAKFESTSNRIAPDPRDNTTRIALLDDGTNTWVLNGTFHGNVFGVVLSSREL